MPQATPKMLTKQLRELEEDRGMVTLFEKLAHERYSVRSFQSKPVEKEKIQKIIAIANSAPTATNAQPVHIWAIVSEEGVRKVNETTKCGLDDRATLSLNIKGKTEVISPVLWLTFVFWRTFIKILVVIIPPMKTGGMPVVDGLTFQKTSK